MTLGGNGLLGQDWAAGLGGRTVVGSDGPQGPCQAGPKAVCVSVFAAAPSWKRRVGGWWSVPRRGPHCCSGFCVTTYIHGVWLTEGTDVTVSAT